MPFTIVPSAPGGVVLADQSSRQRGTANDAASLGWALQRRLDGPQDGDIELMRVIWQMCEEM